MVYGLQDRGHREGIKNTFCTNRKKQESLSMHQALQLRLFFKELFIEVLFINNISLYLKALELSQYLTSFSGIKILNQRWIFSKYVLNNLIAPLIRFSCNSFKFLIKILLLLKIRIVQASMLNQLQYNYYYLFSQIF